MRVPILLGKGGILGCVFLGKISRECPGKGVFCCCKQAIVTNYRDRGYIFQRNIGGSGDGGTSTGPLILREWWGEGREGYWYNNSDSFDMHVSSLIALSHWLSVFWCDFAMFCFGVCHCLMTVFSHVWILRS